MAGYTPQFIAPQGRGRPANTDGLEFPINIFSLGVDTFYDSLAANSNCIFMLNCRYKRGRTLDRRNGFTLKGARGTVGYRGYLLSKLQIMAGNDKMLKIIREGTGVRLYSYTTAGGWATLGAAFGTSADRVDFSSCNVVIGGEERTYFTNGITNLRYTEGTGVNTVTDGATDIRGKYITNIENVMVLAHLTSTFAPNQYVVSKGGTHQFRKDVDLTYANSSNVGTLDSEITGCVTFGSYVYIFTKSDGVWELDINTLVPRVITTHGTQSPKSIAVGHNSMIWCDYDGIWGMTIGGSPERIGTAVDNIYKTADFSNISNFVGTITPDGLYKLSIGDITHEETSYPDFQLVYDIEESRRQGRHVWFFDNNKPVSQYYNWTNEVGVTNSYFIGSDEDSVFVDDSGTSDDGDNILMVWASRDELLVSEQEEYVLQDIFVKLKPDTVDYDVAFYARKNIGSYETLKSFTVSSGSEQLRIGKVQGIPALSGRSLGIKLESLGIASTRIYEMNIIYSKNRSTILPINATL